MELIDLAMKGTPFLLLGLVIAMVKVTDRVSSMSEDIKYIKAKIRWSDTCDERHNALDRRLEKLERKTGLNGSVKDA